MGYTMIPTVIFNIHLGLRFYVEEEHKNGDSFLNVVFGKNRLLSILDVFQKVIELPLPGRLDLSSTWKEP
jgi:hypothetical protein